MIAALLILGVLSLLIGISVWLLFRADEAVAANTHPENKIYVYPTDGIGLADKSTSVFRREQTAPPTVTVRFLNERGRPIGQLEIPASRRKPMLIFEKLGTRHICQASHQDADGTWIYRRSGRE